jgi:uncharacterized protein YbaR (Trm112 family)
VSPPYAAPLPINPSLQKEGKLVELRKVIVSSNIPMVLSSTLLKVLACPRCKQLLSEPVRDDFIVCEPCQIAYPIRQEVPILLEEEASEMLPGGKIMPASSKTSVVYFKIIDGPREGELVKLPMGACRAIGRSLDDLNKTQVLDSQMTVPLDDYTKKMVMNYLSKKGGKFSSSSQEPGRLGEYQRLADLVFQDPAISRLHAMIFNDGSGVGVLDFASRNGTRVNGEEVESRSLKEKDVIKVGGTQLLVTFTTS